MKILKANEAARMLGVNRKTVYECAQRGEIPHRRMGTRLIFLKSALIEWLQDYPQGKSDMYVIKRAAELGMDIVDATEPVQINVTPNDILNSRKANSRQCALARAATRISGVRTGYFFRSIGYLEYRDRIVRFSIPNSLQKEIVSFDRSQIFAPGIYQLSAPAPSGRLRKKPPPTPKKKANARRARKSTLRVRSKYVRHARDPRAA